MPVLLSGMVWLGFWGFRPRAGGKRELPLSAGRPPGPCVPRPSPLAVVGGESGRGGEWGGGRVGRGGGECTRVKWVPFVLLAFFFPCFKVFFASKWAIFPLKLSVLGA